MRVLPRLAAYFGHKVADGDLARVSSDESRVVVQPDFSIIVIGLNPAPAAELRRSASGPREGPVKVPDPQAHPRIDHQSGRGGLEARGDHRQARRHASTGVPANVLSEVRAGPAGPRQVESSTLTVLRCPDRDSADRVLTLLKRDAERLNDTLIGLAQTLTSAERAKLREHGILIETGKVDRAAEKTPAKKKTKRRKRGW